MPLPGVPAWANQSISLYHGTTDAHAASVLAAIDPSRGKALADFGRGFYASSSFVQPTAWANTVAVRRGVGRPAVIRFDVSRDALAALDWLGFVRAGGDAVDFWSFVQHCRTTPTGHVRTAGRWYDLVVGPVATAWYRQTVLADSDQFSFHTPAGAAVLDAGPKARVV